MCTGVYEQFKLCAGVHERRKIQQKLKKFLLRSSANELHEDLLHRCELGEVLIRHIPKL